MSNFAKKHRMQFFLIVSFFFHFQVFAQSLEQIETLGDSLLSHGAAENAEMVYERVLFFSPIEKKAQAAFHLAQSCLKQNKWDKAKEYFRTAISLPSTDSLKVEAFFQSQVCAIFNKEYFLAFIELEKIHFPENSKNEKRRILFQATCKYGLEEYDQAEQLFLSLVRGNLQAETQIKAIFDQKKFIHPLPVVAFAFSFLMPGSGQVYAGDWAQGATSLGANLLLGSTIIEMAKALSWVDAGVTFGVYGLRYFFGGMANAAKIAESKMLKNKDEQFQLILNLVSNQL